jgi:class 3 adenylate cyclase
MHCAAPLTRACTACGADLPDGARFCPACAHPIDAPAGSVSSPVVRARAPRDYTPRHLAEKILGSKSALEGERKQVTVLFADIKGSMELADQVGAEEWHRLLDGFFQILGEGIHRFEGTINQYTGDGIMALFGAPIAHEDHAQRACYAALRLKDELRRYADELRRTRGLSFSVRIGINSGDVVVGTIGDDLRMDYTAQGLTVGLAQRMEQLAAADSIYLTGHAARLVEGFFSLRDLGEFSIKGVSDPLPVFELEGTGSLRTRLELSRSRGFSRFVGRGDEIALLDAALQRTREGDGVVVGVVADAGVGKSRLCLEFIERCRARKVPVYQAHCPAHGRLIPHLPVLELLRDVLGISESDSEQSVREKIAGRLLLLDREFEPLLPLAFDFLGVPDPDRPLEAMDPATRQRELRSLMRRLVRARSAREPAVLLVDDLHWIDSGSDEFLASIAEIVPGTRTLLLLNFRPEYSAEWMSHSSYQQLPLRPLGDEAISELLDHLLGSDPSVAPLRRLIRERTAGNPFFIEELVQSLVEAGSLVGERGSRRLTAPLDRLTVPSSVQAILTARIDRLPAREKSVLQTAAAIGRRFPQSLLRRVCELGDAELDDALSALRRAELIHEESLYPDLEYAFRHPLTHEVAQGSQLTDQRTRVHARIAAAIEEECADRLDENAALLAHHWDEAGEVTPAAHWHRRAAERIAGGNPPEARRHWVRVRDLAMEIDDPRLAHELGEQSRRMVLEYGWRTGISPEEADALLAEGEAWARRNDDPRALAALYNAVSMPFAFSVGEVWRARELALEGLRLAEDAGDEALAFALELRVFFASTAITSNSELEAAIEAANRRPREVMERASPLIGYDAPSAAAGFRAWPQLFAGRTLAALEQVGRGIELARERDAREVLGWLRGIEANAFWLLGDARRALRSAHEAYDIAEEIDSNLSRVVAANSLGPILLGSGDPAAAESILARCEEFAAGSCKHIEPDLLAQLAMARCGLGDLEGARASAERARALASERRLGFGRISADQAMARLALAEPRPDGLREAAADLGGAISGASELGFVSPLPDLHELHAQLAEALGDAELRLAALRDALHVYEGMGAPLQVERIRTQLGE